MTARKPRMGRPPLKARERRREVLSVRFTDQERSVVRHAARAGDFKKSSDWARHVLLATAGDVPRALAEVQIWLDSLVAQLVVMEDSETTGALGDGSLQMARGRIARIKGRLSEIGGMLAPVKA